MQFGITARTPPWRRGVLAVKVHGDGMASIGFNDSTEGYDDGKKFAHYRTRGRRRE